MRFTEARAWGRGGFGCSYQEFCFGHGKLKILARHLSGVKWDWKKGLEVLEKGLRIEM